MRACGVCIALVAATIIAVAPSARANTTYDLVDYPALENGYTLSGTIMTDGVTGVLSRSDIVNWNVNIRQGNTVLTHADSSTGFIQNCDNFHADATGLWLSEGVGTNRFDVEDGVLQNSTSVIHYSFGTIFDQYEGQWPGFGVLWNYNLGNPNQLTDNFIVATPEAVPEPGSIARLLAGGMILLVIAWRRHRLCLSAMIVAITLLPSNIAKADVFNMLNGQKSLQFVTVGDPGNVPDPSSSIHLGGVPYTYSMGKYDVTLAQYCQFLNAVAATDTYGLYNSGMAGGLGLTADPGMLPGFVGFPFGISRSGNPGSYTYSVTGANPQAGNMPVYAETWGDAARFCNWLGNGQPNGGENVSTTESGAYNLSGATSNAALVAVASPAHSGNGAAKYFLPTENEWYKAAYYAGGGKNASYWMFSTQNNTAPDNSLTWAATETNGANYNNSNYTDSTNFMTPVGTFSASPGSYGTYDMDGDVWQWTETVGNLPGFNQEFFVNGGSFCFSTLYMESGVIGGDPPSVEYCDQGFRVASSIAVPEPSTFALLGVTGAALLWRGRVVRRKFLVQKIKSR
jgi:formylglycine-generating enzyme required for sulfatase activity